MIKRPLNPRFNQAVLEGRNASLSHGDESER